MPKQNNISWSEIKNWWPILIALVAITAWLTGWMLTIRIEQVSLKKDMEFVAENVGAIKTNVTNIQQENNTFSNRLTTLEVLHR